MAKRRKYELAECPVCGTTYDTDDFEECPNCLLGKSLSDDDSYLIFDDDDVEDSGNPYI